MSFSFFVVPLLSDFFLYSLSLSFLFSCSPPLVRLFGSRERSESSLLLLEPSFRRCHRATNLGVGCVGVLFRSCSAVFPHPFFSLSIVSRAAEPARSMDEDEGRRKRRRRRRRRGGGQGNAAKEKLRHATM